MIITSATNPKVKQWMKLHQQKYRRQTGLFLIEGDHLVLEAKKRGFVETIIIEEGYFTEDYDYVVTKNVMHKLCLSVSASKIIAVCRVLQPQVLSSLKVLYLENIQDPGNFGTIIRTAVAFGFKDIIYSRGVDIYNDKLIRSTQGAFFMVNLIEIEDLNYLKKLQNQGYYLIGTSLQEGTDLELIKPQSKMILVLGNEGKGVNKETLLLMDENCFVDIEEIESLNVAVAAGIIMYKLRGSK